MDRLKSRKLWMAVVGVAIPLLQMYTGVLTPQEAVDVVWKVVVGYMGAQGLVDAFGIKV